MSDQAGCKCLLWADFGPVLADVRREVRARGLPVTPEEWQECMTDELLARFTSGDSGGARAELLAALEAKAAETVRRRGEAR